MKKNKVLKILDLIVMAIIVGFILSLGFSKFVDMYNTTNNYSYQAFIYIFSLTCFSTFWINTIVGSLKERYSEKVFVIVGQILIFAFAILWELVIKVI